MKKASNVCCIIGLVTNPAICLFLLIHFRLYNLGPQWFITWIIFLFFNVFDAIWGLTTKEPSILLGILLILFVNPPAGIFHLFWRDGLKKDCVSNASTKKVYKFGASLNEEKEKIELLNDYKKLLDTGIITQEEFEKKKESLLK